MEKYLDTFGEFVQFIYENYNTQFKPEDLEADVTESDLLTGSYSSITKYALGHVASIDAFDGSYKAACGLKDVYASGKFFRKDFVFNELYMPTSILAKSSISSYLMGLNLVEGISIDRLCNKGTWNPATLVSKNYTRKIELRGET